MTSVSAREFNQDVSYAKRKAGEGPVVITDRGEPAFVLLSIDDYRKISGSNEGWVSRLQMEEDIDLEDVRLDFEPQGCSI